MSLISVRRMDVLRSTASAYWRCSSLSSVSRSSPFIPMMPFMGVRISWLMLARKEDFARVAASAASRAAVSCSWSFFCCVMSTKLSRQKGRPPRSSRVTVFSTGRTVPSMRTSVRSLLSTDWRRSVTGHLPASAGQMNLWQTLPMIWLRSAPIMAAAASLASTISWVPQSISTMPV